MDKIYVANVKLISKKKEYVAKDVVIAGNSPALLMADSYHRNYLIQQAFKTPAKIKAAMEDPHIRISSIEFISEHGHSHVHWGTTNQSIEVKLKSQSNANQ